jgi:hypothetical protein
MFPRRCIRSLAPRPARAGSANFTPRSFLEPVVHADERGAEGLHRRQPRHGRWRRWGQARLTCYRIVKECFGARMQSDTARDHRSRDHEHRDAEENDGPHHHLTLRVKSRKIGRELPAAPTWRSPSSGRRGFVPTNAVGFTNVARADRERARLTHIFELILGDSQRNVDAGEREVRPPGAPTNERTDWSVADLRCAQLSSLERSRIPAMKGSRRHSAQQRITETGFQRNRSRCSERILKVTFER